MSPTAVGLQKDGSAGYTEKTDEYSYMSEDQNLMTYQQKDGSVGYAGKTRRATHT